MIDDDLKWLSKWYYNQFNNDWRFGRTVKIYTLGNPGWRLKICLIETDLAVKEFQKISFDRSENDWIRCYIENMNFEGACGPLNFSEMLYIFREWSRNYQKTDSILSHRIEFAQFKDVFCESKINYKDDNFMWLLKWYNDQCDGSWENENMIEIVTINIGWYLTVSIKNTKLNKLNFKEIFLNRSDNDWVNCFIKNKEFIGICSPFNLIEIFQIFQNWAESN